jgi:hypothetical protein
MSLVIGFYSLPSPTSGWKHNGLNDTLLIILPFGNVYLPKTHGKGMLKAACADQVNPPPKQDYGLSFRVISRRTLSFSNQCTYPTV